MDGRLQLAADLDMHDRAIEEGGAEILAEGARYGLQSAIRQLGYEELWMPISELEPIEVGDDERSWRVGSEVSMLPFRGRPGPWPRWSFDEARRRYEEGERHAFVEWFHEWAHRMEMEPMAPPIVNITDWLEQTNAWSSFDGRVSIPLAR